MTLRIITLSLLTSLVVALPAAATPRTTTTDADGRVLRARPDGAVTPASSAFPDAFARYLRNHTDWRNQDAFMRFLRNHPNGYPSERSHPDGFASVAADVSRGSFGSEDTQSGGTGWLGLALGAAGGLALGIVGVSAAAGRAGRASHP
jgi:hypothetical protein